jgi:hypothetical protein
MVVGSLIDWGIVMTPLIRLIFRIGATFSCSALSWLYLSADVFEKLSSGLLTLFSILAALLAQVMVFTGMLVSFDGLAHNKVKALRATLDIQQRFFARHFALYLMVILFLIIWQAGYEKYKDEIPKWYVTPYLVSFTITISAWASFSAFLVPGKIVGLQRLRFDIIEEQALATDSKAIALDSGNGIIAKTVRKESLAKIRTRL